MQKVVMSVGGSLINPGKINTKFLKQLKMFVMKSPHKFILVAGGGINARMYAQAGKELGVKEFGRDLLGIQATLLNAELLRQMFKAPPVLQEPKKTNSKITMAGGWLPGCSTDLDAVLWADKNSGRTIINLTNVDYVYDKYPNGTVYKYLTWKDYRKLIADKWTPGMHAPFDPVASRAAEKARMKVFIINGNKLKEINKALQGKKFTGTVIG